MDDDQQSCVLKLKGNKDTDSTTKKLLEKITSFIVEESVLEKTNRKDSILNDISSFIR